MNAYNQDRISIMKGIGILCIFVSFIILQMAIRKTLGVFEMSLERHFKVNATEYGFARSIYNVGYGVMQIPLGIMLDRFGFRVVGRATAFILALAIFLLASAQSWKIACFAQVMIGAGSSGAFISSCKVIKIFPKHFFGFIVSIVMSLGLIGLVLGGIIAAYLLKNPIMFLNIFQEDWQNIMFIYGALTLLITVLISVFGSFRKDQVVNSYEVWSASVFKEFIKNRELQIIAGVSALLVGSFSFACSYQDAFFVRVYGFDLRQATTLSSLVIIGFAFGTPLLVMIGTLIGNRLVVLLCAVLMSISVLLMFYQILGNNITLISIAVLIIGTTCAYQALLFNMGAKSVPHAFSMIAVSIIQFSNMAIGESAYPLVFGALLDGHATGRESMHGYIADDYQYAVWSIVVGCILAFVLLMFVKENKNKV